MEITNLKNVIIGQTNLMRKDNFSEDAIRDFNENTIRLMKKKYSLSDGQVKELEQLL